MLCLAADSAQARRWVPLDNGIRSMAVRSDRSAAGVRLRTNAPGRLTIEMTVDGYWQQTCEVAQSVHATRRSKGVSTYDRLDIPGWTTMSSVGLPAVPVKRLLIPVSSGARPRLRVRSKTEVPVESVRIVPVQPPLPDVYPEPPLPEFAVDEAFYAGDAFYPANNVVTTRLVRVRDQTLLEVELAAIRFRPDSGEALAAAALDVDVVYDVEAPRRVLAEDAALPIYMILMDDQFEESSALSTFVNWKRCKGYDVRTVKTSQINANGAPENAEVVAYMRGLSDADYPEYLLILGDQTVENGVAGLYFSTSQGGYTDLDIACRTATDYLPDLYYGRMPAADSTEAALMLEKALAMDRDPPVSTMFSRVIVAGQIQDKDDGNNRADRLFCETGDAVATYFEQANSPAYACTRAVVNPSGMTAAGGWAYNGYWSSVLWGEDAQIGTRIYTNFVSVSTARARMTDGLNRGAALILHRDHGYDSGAGWVDPQYTYSDVRSLTNGEHRPVVFSINCASGAYHKNNNFTQEWLQHVRGGAYAVFAPVDISYSWFNDWLTHGLMAAFLPDYISFQNVSQHPDWTYDLPVPGGGYGAAGSARRLGQILNFGKMYMYEEYAPNPNTFKLFHLFGDPESYIRVEEPAALAVSHANEIGLGEQSFAVQVGADGVDVCLYSSAVGIHQVVQSSGGRAVFAINPSVAGVMQVTATGYGFRPYEGSVSVMGGQKFQFQAFAMANSVMLRWTNPLLCGMKSDVVRINHSSAEYPAEVADGTVVYTGTNTFYEHTGLDAGVTCYYTIWVSDDGANWTNPPQ